MTMRYFYEEFFEKRHINKDHFFEFGLNENIYRRILNHIFHELTLLTKGAYILSN
jgi:hypothetical protein